MKNKEHIYIESIWNEYYDQLLFLAIEFKKIFMDEWSGRLYEDILEQLADAFSLGVKQVVTHPFLSQES